MFEKKKTPAKAVPRAKVSAPAKPKEGAAKPGPYQVILDNLAIVMYLQDAPNDPSLVIVESFYSGPMVVAKTRISPYIPR
jgi:hypothetical protein